MSRDWRLYLDDLIAAAEKIARFVDGRTAESLQADEARFDAVLFNIQVIGEAAKRLAEAGVGEDVDWSAPARMRDLLAHHYFAVDPDLVFEVATIHVPALQRTARELE